MSNVGSGIHSCNYFIPFTACSVSASPTRTAQVLSMLCVLGSEVTCQSAAAFDPSGQMVLKGWIGDWSNCTRSHGDSAIVGATAASLPPLVFSQMSPGHLVSVKSGAQFRGDKS